MKKELIELGLQKLAYKQKLIGGLVGAGLGAGAGHMVYDKNRGTRRGKVVGGLAGAGLGAGVGHMLTSTPTPQGGIDGVMDKYLKEAIKNNDKIRTRNVLTNAIREDPADVRGQINSRRKEIEQLASKAGMNLWESHNGRSFKPKGDWDESYFSSLIAQLMSTNFSKKRWEHILDVGKEIYKDELL